MKQLIVFDFDGVIAESEILANTVLAEFVTELGVSMTVEDALRAFMGKRLADVLAFRRTRFQRVDGPSRQAASRPFPACGRSVRRRT